MGLRRLIESLESSFESIEQLSYINRCYLAADRRLGDLADALVAFVRKGFAFWVEPVDVLDLEALFGRLGTPVAFPVVVVGLHWLHFLDYLRLDS